MGLPGSIRKIRSIGKIRGEGRGSEWPWVTPLERFNKPATGGVFGFLMLKMGFFGVEYSRKCVFWRNKGAMGGTFGVNPATGCRFEGGKVERAAPLLGVM